MKRSPLKRRTPLRSRSVRARPRNPRILDLGLREALRDRARGRCERCGTPRPPHEAHHKRLRSQGGLDTLENLAHLCRRCHHWAHQNPLEAVREGWILHARAADEEARA